MRHCIRSPPENQITDALQIYQYAVKEIEKIECVKLRDSLKIKRNCLTFSELMIRIYVTGRCGYQNQKWLNMKNGLKKDLRQ